MSAHKLLPADKTSLDTTQQTPSVLVLVVWCWQTSGVSSEEGDQRQLMSRYAPSLRPGMGFQWAQSNHEQKHLF